MYNGQSQQQEPTVMNGETALIKDQDYTLSYIDDTTNAGTVIVTVTGINNYSGSQEVSYEITKRNVTLTSADASKQYDGTALTNRNVTVSGDGFVEGEGATYNVTGSITNVGEAENTFTYTLNAGTLEGNYTINLVFGTLEITPQPDNPDPVDPNPDEPVFTCPEGTVWNDATGMCEVVNPPVVPVVDDDDVPPVDEEVDNVDEDEDNTDDEEVVVIDDDNTPQSGGDEEVVIDDENTPEVGGRGSWALINLIATVVGVILAIVLLASKHQKTEEDEENAEEETEYTRRRKWKVISTITAIVSVIVFVLTENMRLPMVLVDKWTLLMVVFFIINAACLYMGRRFHEEDKDDEATQA